MRFSPRPLHHAPLSPKKTRVVSGEDKENDHLNTEEIYKLLQRKAESPKPPSPTRLNSLSLARFHEAVALFHPSNHVTDMEVRMMHRIHRTVSALSDKENEGPKTPGRSPQPRGSFHVADTGPCEVNDAETLSEVNLGSTHITRRGRLASRSDSVLGSRQSFGSPVARNITPPKSNVVCYTCKARGRDSKVVEKNGTSVCMNCKEASINESVERILADGSDDEKTKLWFALVDSGLAADSGKNSVPLSPVHDSVHDYCEGAAGTPGSPSKPAAVVNVPSGDDWQAIIRRNYEQFVAGPQEKLDITMEDAEDSDEFPSFESDS